MDATFRERLLGEYLKWDRLGKGKTVWQGEVLPEPHFIPFIGHGAFLKRQDLPDDGRRDNAFSSLFRAVRPPPPPLLKTEDPFAIFDGKTPPETIADEASDLTEALWTIPDSVDWKPAHFDSFLYSLGAAERPISFEIIASSGRIELQWALDPIDMGVVASAVEQLPFSSSLEWRRSRLETLLEAKSLPLVWSGNLALAREFTFPLGLDLPADPLGELLRRLSGFERDTVALVQIRFQPCRKPWAESLWRLVTADDGKPFFNDGKRYLDAVKQKCAKPLFAATIRLVVLGKEGDRIISQARQLVKSFEQFSGNNSLVLDDDPGQSREQLLDEILNRTSSRSGMILGGDEMVALVHPPAAGLGAPGLMRLRRKTWPVPFIHRQDYDLELGTCGHGGTSIPCGLTISERLRHVHVLGASGTGKSTFLLNSILQDLEAGHGLAVLDPHGDLVDAILDRLPEKRLSDLVLFDPADAGFPVGFNILRAHTEIEKNLLASDFVAIFERLSSSWGDQMTAVLGNAAMAFLESDEGGTLLDLKRFLIEKGYRDRFLRTVADREIRYFWTHEFPLLRGSTQASLLTRLNGFLRHRLIRNMVAQRGESFDVGRMMDEGKIILAPLSQGLIGQENSWLLGSLLVSRIYQAALSRQAVSESKRRPFFLYLDEAHNFVTPSIGAILSGARKYGLGLVLAHQELDQFPSRESGILSSILTNCHTRVYFQLGDKDAKRLEDGFSHFDSDNLRRLKIGEAICRIGGGDGDFSLDCPPLPSTKPDAQEMRDRAVGASRAAYAVPRDQIENRDSELEIAVEEIPQHPRRGLPKKSDGPFPDPEVMNVPLPAPPKTVEPPIAPEPPASVEPPPEVTAPETAPAKTPGRGGKRHKLIQQMIKQFANGLGLRATIEAELPDRAGCIDVLLANGTTRVAFEIAKKSPVEQEVKNIRKCVEAGIKEIYVVSDETAHLEKIRAVAEASLGAGQFSGVRFVEPSEFGGIFAEIGARLASSETTNRGFRVKVTYNPQAQKRSEGSTRDIHRAVTEHIDTKASPDGKG